VGPAEGRESGALRPGRLGRGRLGWPGWVGRSLFLFLFVFYFFLLFEYVFENPKIIGKIRIRYRWIPCEIIFILEPFLKQK
jgi:hypothetical protein